MTSCGIDLGKNKAALALFEDDTLLLVNHIEVEVPTLQRPGALHDLAEWCALYTLSCEFVFVEEPVAGRNVHESLQIAMTAGAVLARQPDKPTYLVPVSTWKQKVIGKGNASKEEVAAWLKATHPEYAELCRDNQDRIDATCIGLYGLSVERISRQFLEGL